MKVIFVSVVTIIVCALLILKKAYRKQILWGYVLIIVLFSAYYNLRILGTIMSFHRPTLQTFYQEDYLQTGEYPDSLLPLLLEGKTVYTKDDGYAYFEDATIEGKNWLYGFYHKTNTVSYLQFLRANVISDAEMNGTMLSDSQIREEFFQLGPANDMFRYMFVFTPFADELGNAFTYYWYYSDHLSEIDVFCNINKDSNGEDIGTSDELVVLWDSPDGVTEEENFYLMTKAYYEENVR